MSNYQYLIDEYRELGENLRHYSNMRFAQMTLFIAVSAGLLTIVFTTEPPLAYNVRLLLKWGGVVFSFLFLILERRSYGYWLVFFHRLVEIDAILAFRHYSIVPKRQWWWSATTATVLIYLVAIGFWLFSIVVVT